MSLDLRCTVQNYAQYCYCELIHCKLHTLARYIGEKINSVLGTLLDCQSNNLVIAATTNENIYIFYFNSQYC